MKFITETNKAGMPVQMASALDEDGDFELNATVGEMKIKLLYISSYDGDVHLYSLTTLEAETLRALGFKIDDEFRLIVA